MTGNVNKFGRRGGRGWRPWLLIPKVLAVACYLGGLSGAAFIWFTAGRGSRSPASLPIPLPTLVDQVGLMFRFLVVPALLAALLLGGLLTLLHRRQLIRQRWWQVKIAVLALFIPLSHLFMSSRLTLLRSELAAGSSNTAGLQRQLSWAFVVILAISVLIVILGRQKPRLGQNWAADYAHSVGKPAA